MENNQLFKTERFKKNKSRSIIAAVIKDEQLVFGVAKCNRKDSFNKQHGKEIALNRANSRPWYTLALNPDLPIGRQFNVAAKQILAQVDRNFSIAKETLKNSSLVLEFNEVPMPVEA